MFKYIIPIILVVISVLVFVFFTNPLYGDVKVLRERSSSYESALGNAKNLQAVRDDLLTKYNGFSQENISRLQKLIPDNVDNIRLILEIQGIASNYGMQIKNVKYDAKAAAGVTSNVPQNAAASREQSVGYGTFDMEFSTEGSYTNFVNFVRDIEQSLRIVDITSVTFSSIDGINPQNIANNVYKYDFKIKTYWLKK